MLRDKQPRLGQVLESATVLARECGEIVQRCIRLDQEDAVYPLTIMVCIVYCILLCEYNTIATLY